MTSTHSTTQAENNGGVAYAEPRSATPAIASPTEPAIETVPPEVELPKSPAPKRRRPPKAVILSALGVGAIAASVFGFRWWQHSSTHEETENATVAGHVYQISSRIPGRVINVPVDDNEIVQQGELLVQLDPKDYQVKVQQARAALNVAQQQAQVAQTNIALASQQAQAQSTEAQGGVSSAQTAIAAAQAAVTEAQAGVPAAQADLAQAQANLTKAQADFDRYSRLYQSGAIARQQLDTARAARDVAIAQRNAAQQGIAQAQAKLTQAQQGVATAQANLQTSQAGIQRAQAGSVQTEVNRSQYAAATAAIAQAQANLQEAQLQLSYTNITAPASGHIGRKTIEVGQQVTAGQPLMAVVGDEVWVTANFKETQVERMRPGETVEVKLDAFPSRTFTGKVESLSPASGAEFALLPPDNATGNFTKVVQRIPVKIVLDRNSVAGLESQITPGMSATVSVEIE